MLREANAAVPQAPRARSVLLDDATVIATSARTVALRPESASRVPARDERFRQAIGIALPFSPLRDDFRFSALPLLYWPILALTLVGHVVLTQTAKMLLLRRGWI